MTRIVLLVFVFAVTFAPWASADQPQKAELHLWKKDPFLTGTCGHCAEFVNFAENDDRGEFTGFVLYFQSGYYYADLTGPAGTTVTLFGEQDFHTEKGALIIAKKDGLPVHIEDIEAFPPSAWVERPAADGALGSYTAFYIPYSGFKNNIASVKWGKWPDNPAPEK